MTARGLTAPLIAMFAGTPRNPTVSGFEDERPMTEQEVTEALRLNSATLVAEVYDTARRNVDNFGQKLARLDQKATTLLAAIGLSLTVALTYGSQVALARANGSVPRFVLVTFWIAMFLGISAGICATFALFVRDHAEVSDRAIFNAKELREADDLEFADPTTGLASYRRALTVHLWLVAKQREAKSLVKGQAVKNAQFFFLLFIVSILLICVDIAGRLA
jgi:hypothetical protein